MSRNPAAPRRPTAPLAPSVSRRDLIVGTTAGASLLVLGCSSSADGLAAWLAGQPHVAAAARRSAASPDEVVAGCFPPSAPAPPQTAG